MRGLVGNTLFLTSPLDEEGELKGFHTSGRRAISNDLA
jgi:hypothetical protein